jgi:hypothetical protein
MKKNLLIYLGEAIQRYNLDRKTHERTQSSTSVRKRLNWLMPNGGTLLLVIALIATARVWAKPLTAPAANLDEGATSVNYQGHLADAAGNPKDGTFSIKFALYDAQTAGNLIWGPEEHGTVEVSDGLFSVGLGSKASGGIPTTVWNGDRYLEIKVDDEVLSPRELIRSVPIAGMALTVPDGSITDDKLAHPLSQITMLDRYVTLLDSNNVSYPLDGEWHDIDISEKIPDTVKAVIVHVVAEGTVDEFGRIHVGPGGEHQTDYLSLTTSGNWHFAQGMIKG